MLGAGSNWVLSLSKGRGCSPAFVGYLIPCLTVLTVFLEHQKSWSAICFILFSVHCFQSFHWAPLRRVVLHLPHSPSHMFVCTGEMYTCTPWKALLISRPNNTTSFRFSSYNRCSDGLSFTTIVLCFPDWNYWVLDSSQYGLKNQENREITTISTFQSFYINRNHNL